MLSKSLMVRFFAAVTPNLIISALSDLLGIGPPQFTSLEKPEQGKGTTVHVFSLFFLGFFSRTKLYQSIGITG